MSIRTHAAEAQHATADLERWLPLLSALRGQTLRTLQGQSVELTDVGPNGVVFTTAAGRRMPPLPLDQVDRAIAQFTGGFDISQPWRLRVFANVELESYAWALLLHEPFVEALRTQPQRPSEPTAVAISTDRLRYELRSRHGAADPRPPAAKAEWDDERGVWLLPRTPANLVAARSAMEDSLPGAAAPSTPYVVSSRAGLLLFSAYADRDAAKSVPGARWSAQERCWRYPRTKTALRALLDAFGGRLLVPASLSAAVELGAGAPDEDTLANSVEPTAPPIADAVPAPDEALEPDEGPVQGALETLRPDLGAGPAFAKSSLSVIQPEPTVAALLERATPWMCETGRPPAVEWLEGNLGALSFEDPASGPWGVEDVVSLVARGLFDEAVDRAEGLSPATSLEATLLLAARLCAAVRANSPVQLADADLATLASAAPAGTSILDFALRAELPAPARSNAAFCVIAASRDQNAERLDRALDQVSQGTPLFGRAHYLAASVGTATPGGLDREFAPGAVSALVEACTTRQFADLATQAWAADAAALFRSLISHGFVLVLERGDVRDLQREVMEVIEAAECIGVPGLPAIANAAGDALESGHLVPRGTTSAAEVAALHGLAYRIAIQVDAPDELVNAWRRLIRWHAGRGDLPAVVETAREVAFRPAFRLAAETAIAYALAEQGQATAAVSGLAAAYGRLRVSAPADADLCLAEAAAIASGDAELEQLLPLAPLADPIVEPLRAAWPADTRVLIVGANEGVRGRGMNLLRRAGIRAEWLTTEEAHNGDGLRARIRGSADVIVLCTSHISHSIAYRTQEAADSPGAGVPVLLYDRYGPADLTRVLFDWLAGRPVQYRPRGA